MAAISLSSPSSGLRKPSTLGLVQSPASFYVSGGRRSAGLPQFAGLKIQSLNSRNSRVIRRNSNISCQAQGIAVDIPTVTDAMWKSEVVNSEGAVLVEFYASWCGPCRIIHPVIGEVANEYAGKLKCFKLNTDDSPSIATQYGIRSVPTTLLLVNGQKKGLVLGAVPKSTLVASIEKIL